MVLLVERLSKLKCLILKLPRFELNYQTYKRIVDVVRRKPDSSALTIQLGRFSFNYDHLSHFFFRVQRVRTSSKNDHLNLILVTFVRNEFVVGFISSENVGIE